MGLREENDAQVIITGGNSGLGFAFARHYCQMGRRTLLIGRSKSRLRQARNLLIGEYPSAKVSVYCCDLSLQPIVDQLCEELKHYPHLEVVINNAGFNVENNQEIDSSAPSLKMLNVHVYAVTQISLTLVGILAANKGSLINIASIAAFIPNPTSPLYNSTKAFIVNFSQSLHAQYKRHGLKSTVACPGFIVTNFHEKLGLSPKNFYRQRGPLKAHSADWVAQQILKDLLKGRPMSIPGLNYKLAYWILKVLPNRILCWVTSHSTRARL